ncbi:carboxypeptidase-like regulatory domain-containing protein [Cellulophaga baltica]|uniref:carboxypeptidase-like regulatory domain-containing protein n=1 Tax=Cellulophaga baltica TaxID=76594 RepID=UPI0021485C1C|nr:carboxypeptidase-like regulatory domain-containing protein [Cellulophaga baltica]MCR1024519.1 carboxypeptidase-like regulatory domain-containing protein [Cellulophaga baltica]
MDPDYAPIDNRGIKELLVYAKRYAGQIRFYDLPEQSISDGTPERKVSWKEFFRKDVSVITASIGVVDLAQIKKDYDETRANLEANPEADLLTALYAPIIGIAVRLEKWLALTIPTNPLYQDMHLAINSSLSDQLQKSKAIEGGFVVVDPGTELNVDFSEIKDLILWGLDQPIDPDLSVYEGTDEEGKIRNAALFIDTVFLSFYGYLSGLVERSEGYLLASLEDYPSHQPHMALFITFLKLFDIVQDQMNGITERMLNFYYRDVLQLVEKPSIPDKVHVVFELAKGISEFHIGKATELDGGKDLSGLGQIYQTDDEIIVNEAKVVELKTLFFEKALSPGGMPAIKEVYARPVANSVDGYGVPFETEYPIWPAFGKGRGTLSTPKNICDEIENIKEEFHFNNETAIGFALASPQLVLQGGNRIIEYQLEGIDRLLKYKDDRPVQVQLKLTTTEGWLIIDRKISEFDASSLDEIRNNNIKFDEANFTRSSGYYLTENKLTAFLPLGEVPIVGYENDVHEGSFMTSYPIMQVLLGPSIMTREDDLKSIDFRSSNLFVKVGSMNTADTEYSPNMDGLAVLNLENDAGAIEPDKVFDPFTTYPNIGKSLYIGSNEIYNKHSPRLSLNVDFSASESGSFDAENITFKFRYRNNGAWQTQMIAGADTFKLTDLDNARFQSINRKPLTNYEKYSSDTLKGFIQLQLNEPSTPFESASLFQDMQANAERLKVKSIAVSYESSSWLDSEIDQVFHVYPFGAVEVYIPPAENDEFQVENSRSRNIEKLKTFNLQDAAKDQLLVNTDGKLLPQFTYLSPYSSMNSEDNGDRTNGTSDIRPSKNATKLMQQMALTASGLYDTVGVFTNQYSGNVQEEGLLYIGLEHLKPQQTLTLLFQFAEGSAEDTDNTPPEIHWSYLSNNEWRPLPDINIISDGTYGFQTTGIIKIDVPSNATNNNTIVTTGLHWFRTSVTENSNRIPKLIDVVAQAVVAKFDDRDNDQSHFECPLPAESIGKLIVGKAEVKSVMQPFASWNGKAKEDGKGFYTRVSERLRHKARAINAWDYEHLVLNRFPSIYKVKAITHTDPNCLCRNNTITNDPNSTTLVRYNTNFAAGNDLFDPDERAKIEALTIGPKNQMVIITAIDTFGDINSVTDTSNQVAQFFIANGFDAANITINIIANGEPQTIEIQLSGGAIVEQKNCCGPQVSPGHVLVVPISSLKSRNAINPLRPKTGRRTLLEIEDFLKKRTSPFVRVHAKNPVYEQVMVFFKVKFRFGLDKGFYLKQLNEEIVHYLTPWAFDDRSEVKFNQKIYASSIINFIEERDYVDFIKDFFMGVCKDECCSKSIDLIDENPTEEPTEVPVRDDVSVPVDSDSTVITGQILDARNEKPLAGVNVFSPDPVFGTSTDLDGNFSLDLRSPSSLILIQMVGYETKPIMAQANFSWTIYLRPDGTTDEIVVTGTREREDESLEEMFSRFCGCADVEKELTSSDFIGETVINPSTNRSILVSAPKHLIIPCEDEVAPDPCEKRRLEEQNDPTPGFANSALEKAIMASTIAVNRPAKIVKKAAPKRSILKTAASPKKETKPKAIATTKPASKKVVKSKISTTVKAATVKKATSTGAQKSTTAKKASTKAKTTKTSANKKSPKNSTSKK